MELTTFVETLRQELALTVEGQGDEARATAERLVSGLEPAVRLALLEALSAAADEITQDLAPGSVHVRLRGREPAFVVTLPPAEAGVAAAEPAPAAGQGAAPAEPAEAGEDATVRINVRLGERLKHRIEEAAARSGLSVNAWLGRAAAAALNAADAEHALGRSGSPVRAATGGQRYTGWVR
jgi:hypothetical protein